MWTHQDVSAAHIQMCSPSFPGTHTHAHACTHTEYTPRTLRSVGCYMHVHMHTHTIQNPSPFGLLILQQPNPPELEATAQRRGYESCFSNEAGRMAQGRRLQSCRQGRYFQMPWLPRLLSEIQRGQIPKVTVKEISDAFTLFKAKVVVEGLVGWGKADELPREERREVFSTVLQE